MTFLPVDVYYEAEISVRMRCINNWAASCTLAYVDDLPYVTHELEVLSGFSVPRVFIVSNHVIE